MGMSASQARLLTITARLTSNEYESQQITNAKMRLATQSQEASEAYISALNSTQYAFVTYDSSGNSNNTPLTAAVLYEYGDNKNQYIITTSSGKALVSNKDYENYENSANLDEFLECYGITKTFQTDKLEESYTFCKDKEKGHPEYKTDWEEFVKNQDLSEDAWKIEKHNRQDNYLNNLNDYTTAVNQRENGGDISLEVIDAKQKVMENAKKSFTDYVSYQAAKESTAINQCIDQLTGQPKKNEYGKYTEDAQKYVNYLEYQSYEAAYNDELDRLGLSADSAYQYSDTTKAQWYTNLWYKINGESTDNSGLKNCAVLNPAEADETSTANSELSAVRNLATMNSTNWISDALAKGYINLEMAEYSGETKTLQDNQDPFKFNLKGITWNAKIYSSCPDIISTDNDKAVAQAEAEYERKTAEINAKDEKYQRKLSLLDSEHNAIQQEYESVKGAMDKNIERSFKAFQG